MTSAQATALVNLAVDAIWTLSNALRAGAEALDDAATATSRLGHRLHDQWWDYRERCAR